MEWNGKKYEAEVLKDGFIHMNRFPHEVLDELKSKKSFPIKVNGRKIEVVGAKEEEVSKIKVMSAVNSGHEAPHAASCL